jgi:hypothetical protein
MGTNKTTVFAKAKHCGFRIQLDFPDGGFDVFFLLFFFHHHLLPVVKEFTLHHRRLAVQ